MSLLTSLSNSRNSIVKSPIKSFREFDFGHVIAETITAVVTRSEGQFWNFPEFSAKAISTWENSMRFRITYDWFVVEDSITLVVDAGVLNILSDLSEYEVEDGMMSEYTISTQKLVATSLDHITSFKLGKILRIF